MRHRVNWKRVPSQLQATGTILRQEPSKLNPCPTVWYVFVLTKVQGKGTLALPKNLPRLLITSWQRKDVWKTLFQNKSGGTINPVYLPQTTPEQYKESVNQKTLSITNLAQYFYPATLEEHPINNHDLNRALFWKTCTGKKCINFYTLDLGWDVVKRHLLELSYETDHGLCN